MPKLREHIEKAKANSSILCPDEEGTELELRNL